MKRRRDRNRGRVFIGMMHDVGDVVVGLGNGAAGFVMHDHGGRHLHVRGTVLRRGEFVVEGDGRTRITNWYLADQGALLRDLGDEEAGDGDLLAELPEELLG